MSVLIVEESHLHDIDWAEALVRLGLDVQLAESIRQAEHRLAASRFMLVLIDLAPDPVAGLALCDYIGVRQPWARVMLVTGDDPRIEVAQLMQVANACAVIGRNTPPGDLALMAARHAAASDPRRRS